MELNGMRLGMTKRPSHEFTPDDATSQQWSGVEVTPTDLTQSAMTRLTRSTAREKLRWPVEPQRAWSDALDVVVAWSEGHAAAFR